MTTYTPSGPVADFNYSLSGDGQIEYDNNYHYQQRKSKLNELLKPKLFFNTASEVTLLISDLCNSVAIFLQKSFSNFF